MLEFLNNLDTQLFIFLNGINSPFWDVVMRWISGSKSWIPMYLVIVAYIVYKFRWKAIITLVFIALVVTLADQISVKAFKEVFERLRPCHNPELQDIVHLVKNKCGGKYGFVSSHAANTFGVAFFLSLFFKNRNFSIFIFIWASVVSYSRIYLGVHYPFDVLGGAILGSVIGYFVYLLHNFTLQKVSKHFKSVKL
ncbi:MAG: phosphatase PAP2 family protein [Bacteroidales bacterium]|nr:phosphatase PAP2 family protein [Bacteroidales bacterium]